MAVAIQITGSSDVTVTGNASIIVNGGTLNNSICGGSSRVGGNTSITVSKGTVKGKLYDSASVTVGGEATVGNGNSGGIIINGGSPTELKTVFPVLTSIQT